MSRSAVQVVSAPTDAPFEPFARMLQRNAAERPDDEAIVFEGERILWKSFYDRVARAGARLVAQGLERGDRVAIMGRPHRPMSRSISARFWPAALLCRCRPWRARRRWRR